MKIRYRSRDDRRFDERRSSPMGDGTQPIFEERLVDGKKMLVVTGQEDLKAFIEASKDETLISSIIKRYTEGDVTALSRAQGFYADITGMPTDLASAQQTLIKLQDNFDKLPLEVRKKFDNSFDKYVEEVSSISDVDTFKKIFDLSEAAGPSESSAASVNEEVINNE